MKALKTIVATAVIAFTATTVATAGVHAVTQQNGTQANPIASHQAKKAQKYYPVSVSANDLQRLTGMMNGQRFAGQHKATKARSGYTAGNSVGQRSGRCYQSKGYRGTTQRATYHQRTYRCWGSAYQGNYGGGSRTGNGSGSRGNGGCW